MSHFSFVPRATALAAATFALSFLPSTPAIAGPAVMSTGVPAANCGAVGSPTLPGTLSSYQAAATDGCMVGTATFFSFTRAYQYLNDNPTVTNPAPAILVAPGAIPAAPSLAFSSPLFHNTSTTSADYYFEYFIDPPIDILGFSLRDAPFVLGYVEASVCVGATFNDGLRDGFVPPYGGGGGAPRFTGAEGTPMDSCSFSSPITEFSETDSTTLAAAAIPEYYHFFIDGAGAPTDVQTFAAPSQFVDVLIHVHLDPGGNVDFSTGPVLATPEPGELALTGIGGLALLGTTLRRRRRGKTSQA